jgi:chromosome segregation ATPase
MEDDTSFVSNASSRSKPFGHNKFQVQLLEANSKIESLEQLIKGKDSELELFKNNIRSFQLQFQEKNIEILQLKQNMNNYKNNLELVTFDLNKLNVDKTSDKTSLTNKCDNLHDENTHLLNTITQLHKTNNETLEKYNDLKLKYQTTLDLLEKKSNEYTTVTSDYTDSVNELNLLKELNLKQEKDIETIKQQLFQSKNETSVLKSQLFEKDISLGELHKKLALERYTIRGKIIEQPIYIQETEVVVGEVLEEEPVIEQDSVSANRQVKVTTQRGVKLSKR